MLLLNLIKQGIRLGKLYSVKEFSEILRVHPNTVRKMIKLKRLHPIMIGSTKRPTYKIPEEDLLRLEAEGFNNETFKEESDV